MEDLKYQAEPNIVIMLVGNKIDLVEKNPSTRYYRSFYFKLKFFF